MAELTGSGFAFLVASQYYELFKDVAVSQPKDGETYFEVNFSKLSIDEFNDNTMDILVESTQENN